MPMQYVTELMDRSTGSLVQVELGEYVTVTELGQRYNKGPNEIRSILHHMGLLRGEGRHRRYRLAPFAVEAGLGKRHENPRSGHPFDVLSPKGQQLVALAWDDTIADLQKERSQCPKACHAKAALEQFCADRERTLTTQQQVSWLQHHFNGLTNRQIASIISVSEQLVGRYVSQAINQKDYRIRMRACPMF
jgi:hypothetical protein